MTGQIVSHTTKSARQLCLVVFVLAMLLLWSGIGFSLRALHKEVLQNAATDGSNLAHSIAENESASIRSIDLLVRYFCQEWQRAPGAFATMVEHHREFLATASISQVAVIDAKGLIAFSNIPGWKPIDLSDRQHFKVHKERGTDEMFISSPVLGRVSQQWTIQFTRPILDAQGQFAGVLVVSIPPPALVRNYNSVNLGEGSVITLARFDGQVMGRSGGLDKAVNISLADSPGLHPEDPQSGEYFRDSLIDGTKRFYRYEKVGPYPFTVFVGQSMDQVLEPYYRQRMIHWLVGGVATALMIALCLLIVSRVRKSEEAERSRARFEAALQQSEERFRLIAETIDTVVWSVDLSSARAFYISPSYERIWGRRLDDATGTGHPLVAHVCSEDRARIAADFALETADSAFEHEYRIERPDGTQRWIWGRGFPVRNADGAVTRFVGVAQDITVLKRTQEEITRLNQDLERRVIERTADLQSANASLLVEKEHNKALIKKFEDAQMQLLQSEKMASIGQLAAGVAHEINNPVGFVNSNLGVLKTYFDDILSLLDAYERYDAQLTPEQREALLQEKQRIDIDYLRKDLDNLYSESMEGLLRVKRIVQDLKDFSRIGNAERTVANIEKGLDSTINVAWNELKYKAEVRREYAGIPEIECIPSQLNQVFMNLLVNAAHSIRDKGDITVRTGQDEGCVWVEVSDTGCGIAPENLQRIFDPFFTTKPVGRGTGLGLSLSYGIVQKHGGRIEVQSTVGEGSTFRVVLPVVMASEDVSAPAPEAGPQA